jgi:hypothetical protein
MDTDGYWLKYKQAGASKPTKPISIPAGLSCRNLVFPGFPAIEYG